jgi:rubrerythrin
MSEKIIALAEFATLAEAHLALELLRQHSIQGFVSDDTTNPVNFSVLGRMPYAPGIQLHVKEAQAVQARQLLQSRARQKPVKEWEKQAEEVDGWLCHLCDTHNEVDSAICPACGEPRQTHRKKKR